MRPGIKNLPASVLARLRNYARETNQTFNEVLTYYGLERFLYRISKSQYKDQFVLKGALVMFTWPQSHIRTTRDMDLRAFIQPDEDSVEEVIREICMVDVEQDALIFDIDSVTAETIVEREHISGIRTRFVGYIENVRINLQIDMSFTDPVVPEPTTIEFPTILDFPNPRVRAYPVETVVAEKLEAVISLGDINTRMKDFYDLILISENFRFDGNLLIAAVKGTFEARKTTIPIETPIGLSDGFAKDNQNLWEAYLRRIGDEDPRLLSFHDVIADIRNFLGPILQAANEATNYRKTWIPARGWI